jgi:hypothetical protein
MVADPAEIGVLFSRKAPCASTSRGFTNDAKELYKHNRHSGMLLAGIQTRATTGFLCGWIPAKGMWNDNQ